MHLIDAASGNSFGVVNLGGGVRGTSQAVSFIGSDTSPDLVVAGQGEAGTPVYIVSGAALTSMTGSVDVSAAQSAVVPPIVKIANRLPADWGGYAGQGLIIDSNNDGWPDFALGEFAFTKPGRVVVFY